jgi:serine/threonine protein kinase
MVEKIHKINKGLDKFITGKNKTTVKIGEVSLTVDNHYKIIGKLGKGAYGQVVKAIDLSEEDEELNECAIKKIEEIFEHATYAKRCLRELKILRLLNHENVCFYYIIIRLFQSKML